MLVHKNPKPDNDKLNEYPLSLSKYKPLTAVVWLFSERRSAMHGAVDGAAVDVDGTPQQNITSRLYIT